MHVIISNMVLIINPTREILKFCERELAVSNPEYIKKERMGLWVGNTPRVLELYIRDGRDIIVPVGAFRHIKDLIDSSRIPCTYEVDLGEHKWVNFNASMGLYDYQAQAVIAMSQHGFGILQAPTGSGKKHFLFATYSLAKEGLDIPRLDRLHLVTPQKDYAVIVQSVGRIARTFEGKEQPICYDYVDGISITEKFWKARCRNYKKCGCSLSE